jgi:hypothetical protein
VHPFSKPCGELVRGYASDAQLPNQFRCQTSKPSCCSQDGPPWGGKNLPMLLACFQIGVTTKGGSDLETVNEFWWS